MDTIPHRLFKIYNFNKAHVYLKSHNESHHMSLSIKYIIYALKVPFSKRFKKKKLKKTKTRSPSPNTVHEFFFDVFEVIQVLKHSK